MATEGLHETAGVPFGIASTFSSDSNAVSVPVPVSVAAAASASAATMSRPPTGQRAMHVIQTSGAGFPRPQQSPQPQPQPQPYPSQMVEAPSAFLVPKNPRDTALGSASPKRRALASRATPASGATPPTIPMIETARSEEATLQQSSQRRLEQLTQHPHPHPKQTQKHAHNTPKTTRSAGGRPHSHRNLFPGSITSNNSASNVSPINEQAPIPISMSMPISMQTPASASASVGSSIVHRYDPEEEEQILFEQRLCEDAFGVAVRKINHGGKAQLRYVKCVPLQKYGSGSEYGHDVHSVGVLHYPDARSMASRTVGSVNDVPPAFSLSPARPSTHSSGKSVSSILLGRRLSSRKNKGGTPSSAVSLAENGVSQNQAQHQKEGHNSLLSSTLTKRSRALTWGKKNEVRLSLDRFVAVRKGKTTDRTRRNTCPADRLLSIVTDEPAHPSLDIEAPTKLDRDKFARAFARFLGVPLEIIETDALSFQFQQTPSNTSTNEPPTLSASSSVEGDSHVVANHAVVPTRQSQITNRSSKRFSEGHSGTDKTLSASASLVRSDSDDSDSEPRMPPPYQQGAATLLPEISPDSGGTDILRTSMASSANNNNGEGPPILGNTNTNRNGPPTAGATTTTDGRSSAPQSMAQSALSDVARGSKLEVASSQVAASSTMSKPTSVKPAIKTEDIKSKDDDDQSNVSSLTAGFDQELVEELHQALTELRSELEASRAEAARAVKVAEQAIQSAESCTSNDWNSTVTHKAAEAAAQAQKRSAEAMARQRLAEERLAGERRSATFWRRQAEAAEEEAGALQTRAAAAEVQRASMEAELESEQRKTSTYISSLKNKVNVSESLQREAMDSAMERNRSLEIELDGTRRDLITKSEETKGLQDTLADLKTHPNEAGKYTIRRKMSFARKKKNGVDPHQRGASGTSLLLGNDISSSTSFQIENRDILSKDSTGNPAETINVESVLKLHAETAAMRTQFELLRRATSEELRALPEAAKEWANQAARALASSGTEISRLRRKLALESATRRKLLNEVQDLRGTVRVYCRPQPMRVSSSSRSPNEKNLGIISVPSHETLLVHRERVPGTDGISHTTPMSFEFDRVFSPDSSQNELYSEMEECVLGVLDGYNVCLMAYGQTGSGKTHTMVGDYSLVLEEVDDEVPKAMFRSKGLHLQAMGQLFTIAEKRSQRYQDSFSITIVEVHNERLCDLAAGTDIAESCGEMQGHESGKSGNSRQGGRNGKKPTEESTASQHGNSTTSRPNKLEIRTNYDGDTVVQGVMAIPVKTMLDVHNLWEECLSQRAARLMEQGADFPEYEATSHVIVTVNVISTNIATGVGTVGKIQFVDLAGSDLVPKRPVVGGAKGSKNTAADGLLAGVGNNTEWKFANKSLATLSDVVGARCQFMRSVPYRNSTLTHLLRDSIEADTKVLLVVCVSSDPKNLQETASSLRFASRMRRVNVGKATKHTVSLA